MHFGGPQQTLKHRKLVVTYFDILLCTLDSLINVLHAYLFLETFSYHHNLISLDIFFTLGLIHSKMLLMV